MKGGILIVSVRTSSETFLMQCFLSSALEMTQNCQQQQQQQQIIIIIIIVSYLT